MAALSCRSAYLPPARAGLHLSPVPGPEDFEIQLSGPAAPRLLVSSQSREYDSNPGNLFSIPLVSGGRQAPPSALELTGRGDCSFHPHGISLVTPISGPPTLYVINHHDAEDVDRCLHAPVRAKRFRNQKKINSIEVYEEQGNGASWHMRERLCHPYLLTRPNDLAALSNGLVYVTNMPKSNIGFLYEALLGHSSSSVVMFDGLSWHRLAGKPRLANGIAVDWVRGRLYVAEMAKRRIDVLALDGPGGAKAPTKVGEIAVGSGVDNLSWGPEGPEGRTLWVAAHPSLLAFVKLGRAWKRHHADKPLSPSEVYRIRLCEDSGTSECVFGDGGQLISGASTAMPFEGSLLIGQVFDNFVLRYPFP